MVSMRTHNSAAQIQAAEVRQEIGRNCLSRITTSAAVVTLPRPIFVDDPTDEDIIAAAEYWDMMLERLDNAYGK